MAQFLRSNRTGALDWAATCLFYAAVHYVNAYLAKNGKPIPRRHRGDTTTPGRLNIVQQDPTLSAIYSEYRHLDDESRDARYELRKPTQSDYDNFLLHQLETIRNYVTSRVAN